MNASEDESGSLQPLSALGEMPRHCLADQPYLIEEGTRPGQLMPITEDEHGSYIMNSKDLRAVEHVERLVKIGVKSLKVEGRTKSIYYVARTTQVYRRAINDAVAGRPFDGKLLAALNGLASRGYTDGFLQRHHTQEYQNYLTGSSQLDSAHYVGDVQRVQDGWAEVLVKNRFSVGDRLEIIHPKGNAIFTLEQMVSADGNSINIVPGSGNIVKIPLDPSYDKAFLVRLL